MSAEILSWNRSKGLFAGIALTGATLRPDNDVDQELYGSKLTNKEILTGDTAVPTAGRPLIAALSKYSPVEAKDKPIESRAKDAVEGDADRRKKKK
jgi:lipid-binding SYLF domain-containing protein